MRIGIFPIDDRHNPWHTRAMNRPREQAFLTRLWELQAEAGLSDTALARELGVNQSHIWRAKNDPSRTFGIKFALGACDRFPELRDFLFGEMPIST